VQVAAHKGDLKAAVPGPKLVAASTTLGPHELPVAPSAQPELRPRPVITQADLIVGIEMNDLALAYPNAPLPPPPDALPGADSVRHKSMPLQTRS